MLALALTLLLQDPLTHLESTDPVIARRAFEAAIKTGDEKALEAAGKTSERARRALAEVRAHKRFGDAYPAPALVTLEFSKKPFNEAMAELSKAIGVAIESAGDAANPNSPASDITFKCEGLYPVEAIEKFGRAANVRLAWAADRLHWYPGAGKEKALYVARHFALSMNSYQESETLNSAGEKSTECSIGFNVVSDGQVRIAGQGATRLQEVLDESGASLVRKNESPTDPTGGWAPWWSFIAGAKIEAPPAGSRELSVVKGTVEVLVAESPRIMEFAWEAKPATLELPNLALHVKPDRSKMLLSGRVVDSKKPYVWPRAGDFSLGGRDGRSVTATGSIKGNMDALNGELEFSLPAGFEASHLRVRVFDRSGPIEVPFEFRGVTVR